MNCTPGWRGIAPVLLTLLLVAACGGLFGQGPFPTQADLRQSLPAATGGVELTVSDLTDTPTGLLVDDAIIALGKTRDQAVIVGGESSLPVDVLAIAIQGVGGEELEQAVVTYWLGASSVAQGEIGGQKVQIVVNPGGERVYVFRRGIVVYAIQTNDVSLATEVISGISQSE